MPQDSPKLAAAKIAEAAARGAHIGHLASCPPCSSARSKRRPYLACPDGLQLRARARHALDQLRLARELEAQEAAGQGTLFTVEESV